MINRLLIIILFFSSVFTFAQNAKTDSLIIIVQTTKTDTLKINALNDLFLQLEFKDQMKAKEYLAQSLKLAQKIDYKKGLAVAYNYSGYLAEDKDNYPEALTNYQSSLKISEKAANKKGMAASYNNIGTVFSEQGNYPAALKNYFSCLKIYDSLHDEYGIASSYNNIGNIYSSQDLYPEALKNYEISLQIRKALTDSSGMSVVYNNIGNIYSALADRESIPSLRLDKLALALQNHLASLKIRKAIHNKKGIATSLNNIGNVYYALAELEKIPELQKIKLEQALENYNESLKIREEIKNTAGIAASYSNIGNVFSKLKQYKKAESYLIKARDISKKIGYKEYLKGAYRGLTALDSAKGDFRGAFDNHKLFILYRDSLDNEETQKKTIQSQLTYDFEKKEAIADAEHKKELENQKLLADEKSRKQKIVLLFVASGLLLVLVFAGFIFRSLNITRKQKSIIEEQKIIVEEKQKEIIDSITYARRIQRSLLPSDNYIEKQLKKLKKSS